jgi:hypothetical protein
MTRSATETVELPVVSPEEILQDVATAAETHAAATQLFIDNFIFYGSSLSQWSDNLAIPVPAAKDLTPEITRELFVKLANNLQIVNHFFSVSNTISSTLVGGSSIKKADLVRYIVQQYEQGNKTRPAASAIEQMADSYMKSTVSSRVAAKIVRDFWRDRRDMLIELRKVLEQISMNTATELKYLTGEMND